MDYTHAQFGSLAVRTRYGYLVEYSNLPELVNGFIPDKPVETEIVIFRSARMALKAIKEIENDECMILLEYREIQIHC